MYYHSLCVDNVDNNIIARRLKNQTLDAHLGKTMFALSLMNSYVELRNTTLLLALCVFDCDYNLLCLYIMIIPLA